MKHQCCIVGNDNGLVKIYRSLIGTNQLGKVLLTGTGNDRVAIEFIRKFEIMCSERCSVIPGNIVAKRVGDRKVVVGHGP